MLQSDINQLFNDWFLDDSKVFKIKYDFAEPDTLVITKEKYDLFVVDLSKSTTSKFKEFTKDQLQKSLNNGTIVHMPNSSSIVDYKSYRTGGCTCGAWATSNPNCHAYWCDKNIGY